MKMIKKKYHIHGSDVQINYKHVMIMRSGSTSMDQQMQKRAYTLEWASWCLHLYESNMISSEINELIEKGGRSSVTAQGSSNSRLSLDVLTTVSMSST